jgi:hypothetical protein
MNAEPQRCRGRGEDKGLGILVFLYISAALRSSFEARPNGENPKILQNDSINTVFPPRYSPTKSRMHHRLRAIGG